MSRRKHLRTTFAIIAVLATFIGCTELARFIVRQSAERNVQHSAHRNLHDLQTVLMVYSQATGDYPDALDDLYPKYIVERLESWPKGGASSVIYHYNKPNDLLNGDFVIITYTASLRNKIRSFRLHLDGRIREVE